MDVPSSQGDATSVAETPAVEPAESHKTESSLPGLLNPESPAEAVAQGPEIKNGKKAPYKSFRYVFCLFEKGCWVY